MSVTSERISRREEPLAPDQAAMRAAEEETSQAGPARPIGTGLHGQGLVRVYGKRRVVDGVDISVRPGEVVGLLGPNGAGKTTTFYLLTGLVSADAGRVYLDGRDITALAMHRRSRLGLGYLPQEASIFRKMTVEQNLLAILEMVGLSRREQSQRVEQLLAEFAIERIRGYKGNQISGGERRRVEVARALCSRPRYLLLDEPFLGVDPITVVEIQEIISGLIGRGIGVILTDHNVWDTLRITDRAYVMYEGRVLVQGTPAQIAASPLARRFYLGDRFRL
jgi:lipopolysaccharide export system ATP-binding protein